jgi:hypothetical protein
LTSGTDPLTALENRLADRDQVRDEQLRTMERKLDEIRRLLKGDDFHPDGLLSEVRALKRADENLAKRIDAQEVAWRAFLDRARGFGVGIAIGSGLASGVSVGVIIKVFAG